MAKAKKKKEGASILSLPVKYGKVSIGENTASIPIKCSLQDLSLATAYQKLCGKRITGNIEAQSGGAQAKQQSLVEGANLNFDATFDVKGFAFNKKKISTTISFMLESIDIEKLAHFANREGTVTALEIDDIPDGKEDDSDDEDDDDDAGE